MPKSSAEQILDAFQGASVPPDIVEQLFSAFRAAKDSDGLTLEDLLERAQRRKRNGKPVLDCDFTSLSRKLHGKQGTTVAEARVIAEALSIEIDWTPRAKASGS